MTTSLYQTNFEALRKARPDIAARLPEFSLDHLSKRFTVEILPNSGVTLRERDFVVDTTAEGFLPAVSKQDSSIRTLFICGFGVGGLFHQMTKSLSNQVHQIFIIEPSVE